MEEHTPAAVLNEAAVNNKKKNVLMKHGGGTNKRGPEG